MVSARLTIGQYGLEAVVRCTLAECPILGVIAAEADLPVSQDRSAAANDCVLLERSVLTRYFGQRH